MTRSPRHVLLAEIGAPHGVRGEVRVKSYTAEPSDFAAYGPLFDADGRRYAVRAARALKDDLLVVSFEGISDRTAAERLTRTQLFVDRSSLPQADDEEFYHADLLGLAVETTRGEAVGTIIAVPNFGSDDLLEVARPGRRSVYVPFTRAVVPVVDVAAGRVIIEPPEGLLDDDGDEDGDASGDTPGDPAEGAAGP
jgi:16S rRNA processing protein RimM